MTLSFKTTARLAGFFYLIVALAGAFNLMVAPAQFIVDNDPAKTLANITADPTLFRLAILSGVACQTAFLFVGVLLYVLFAPAGRIAALLLITFVTASVPIAFGNIGQHIGLADLAAAPSADLREAAQFMNAYGRGLDIVSIFWGLWLLPFGWLVVRTAAIPRVIGVFLILGGLGYVVSFVAEFFSPSFAVSAVADYIHLPSAIGELSACLWLLIMGATDKRFART